MSEAETLTIIVILLAGLGLLVLNQIRKNKKALLALVDKAEDKIEDVTGLDIELSEAVEDVLDKALDTADELSITALDFLVPYYGRFRHGQGCQVG